jgi:hypothetical protein
MLAAGIQILRVTLGEAFGFAANQHDSTLLASIA